MGGPSARHFAFHFLAAASLLCGACAGCVAQQPNGGAAPAPRELSPLERDRMARHENELHSDDLLVRRQAAVALLAMNHPAALELVTNRLHSAEKPEVRVSMIQAAAFVVDHRMFGSLLAAVADPSEMVRQAAADALARFTRDEEVQEMVAFVRREGATAEQKRLLFEAFGRGVALRAVPVLLEGMESPDETVRTAAVIALQQISDRKYGPDVEKWRNWWLTNAHRTREDLLQDHLLALRQKLDAQEKQIAQLAEQQDELLALVKLPENGNVRGLLTALESEHESVREYASHRLAMLDKEKTNGVKLEARDFALLRRLLDDADATIRRNVMRFAVGQEGRPREELVLKGLDDPDVQVAVTAVNAVTPATGPVAVERLGTLLTVSPHTEVREAAANALGKVGTKESIPGLTAALTDTSENVRWFAVESLRKLGAVDAVPALQEVLKEDESARVREIAASALGALGQPAAIPTLRDALDDANERVRQKTVAALLALAKDDYDSMALVADVLAERKMYAPAAQVLGRIIEQFSEAEGMADRITGTYARLADVLTKQEDYAGAARALEKLDTLKGGDAAVRQQMINAWIQAGETARVNAAFEKWFAAREDKMATVLRALDVVDALVAADKKDEARTLLQMAGQNAGEAPPEEVKARIDALVAALAG